MCKNWVCSMHACGHESYAVLERAKGGVCIFESSPDEENYCTLVGFEPVFYMNHAGPCADCDEKDNNTDSTAGDDNNENSNTADSTAKDEDNSRPRSLGKTTSSNGEPSLRRAAILNATHEHLDEENEDWDPTGVVEDTLTYRLMNVDTTLDGAALWARLIVTLPKGVFQQSDKMHLMAIWHGQVKGKYTDEELETIVSTLARERGPGDQDMVKIKAAFDAAPKRSAE
ncbi:hypothetical protein PG988_000433 [Apiospora saccharicola]